MPLQAYKQCTQFNLESELDGQNALHKVDVLAAALAEFRRPR